MGVSLSGTLCRYISSGHYFSFSYQVEKLFDVYFYETRENTWNYDKYKPEVVLLITVALLI